MLAFCPTGEGRPATVGIGAYRTKMSDLRQADLIKDVRILDFLVTGQQEHFAHHFHCLGIVVRKRQEQSAAMFWL